MLSLRASVLKKHPLPTSPERRILHSLYSLNYATNCPTQAISLQLSALAQICVHWQHPALHDDAHSLLPPECVTYAHVLHSLPLLLPVNGLPTPWKVQHLRLTPLPQGPALPQTLTQYR